MSPKRQRDCVRPKVGSRSPASRGQTCTPKHSLLDEVCFLLGGIAAEEVILGSRSTGAGGTRGSDLHLATLTALRLETSYGLGQGLAFLSADGEGDLWRTLRVSPSVRERVEAILTEQMSRACSIVRRHRHGLDQVTMELLEKKKIGFASIAAMISNSDLVTRSR